MKKIGLNFITFYHFIQKEVTFDLSFKIKKTINIFKFKKGEHNIKKDIDDVFLKFKRGDVVGVN